MKKLTDQELDSVFKQAADGYEPAFDSAAWDAMNAKLDQPKPTIWKGWMTFALLGLVIFSIGVWVGTYIDEEEQLAESILKENAKESIQQNNTTKEINQNQVQIAPNQTAAGKESLNRSSQQRKSIVKELNDSFITSNDEIEKNRALIVADTDYQNNESKLLIQEDTDSKESIMSVSDRLADTVLQQIIVDRITVDTMQVISAIDEERKKFMDRRAIFLRALASPDFSSVNYSSTSKTGSNFSVLVEYQLTNRWSITTGGIWSMKKYSENSKVSYGKFTADRMVGSCQVLDIPVDIYYRFRPQLKTSFYAGIGLSSYVMLEEDYTYTVDYSSGSRDYAYYIEGENNEWFKMLNLSVGMQYQIAPRIHIQAEPFFKAPLAGIGEWDVQLSSVGVFLGIKYKIN